MEAVQILLDYWPEENSAQNEAYQRYFEWLVEMYNNPEWKPEESEILELANQCPLTSGTIIYAVRNLYNAMTQKINEFTNNCEGMAARGGSRPSFVRVKQPAKKPVAQDIETRNLLLYPNPATNIVNIGFAGMKQVQVFDISGRIVLNKQLGGVGNIQLNVSTFGKGVFLVKVTVKDGTSETRKLVIQ